MQLVRRPERPVWKDFETSPSPGLDPRTVQHVASRYTDYATRPTFQKYPPIFPVPDLGNVLPWVHCRIPVVLNVYKLLLPFLLPSLTFPSHKLTHLLHCNTCFPSTVMHQYATFCLPHFSKQFTFAVPFSMWHDIALNYGMTYNTHQSGTTILQHAVSCR